MITSNTHSPVTESRGPTVLIPKGVDTIVEDSAPRYACHRCGATSYRALMARGTDGAMRASGRHACTGCRFEFEHVSDWTGARMETSSADAAA